MALTSIANPDGDIVIDADGQVDPDGEFCIQSLGDPALDRILVRCHATEMAVRQLSGDVQRLQKGLQTVRSLAWVPVIILAGWAVAAVLR